MNKTIDYFINSENDIASFEYYFEEELNIKSVTLKSIMFYIAHVDIKHGISYSDGLYILEWDNNLVYLKEINLKTICDFMNAGAIPSYVRYHSDKNHLILELLEDEYIPGHERYTLSAQDTDPDFITFNELFGFNDQEKFYSKGKYRSPKSIIDTPPILYLRSNLVDKQNTFYNNKYSDIFCEFPVDVDDDENYFL